MPISEADFLKKYQPRKPWICSVVDYLLTQPKGTATFERIALAIDSDHEGVQAVRECIYSAVRPRCPDLTGYKDDQPALFRKSAGALSLIDYPNRPETGQEGRLRFEEESTQRAYEALEPVIRTSLGSLYPEWAAKPRDEKWSGIARIEAWREFVDDVATRNKRLGM